MLKQTLTSDAQQIVRFLSFFDVGTKNLVVFLGLYPRPPRLSRLNQIIVQMQHLQCAGRVPYGALERCEPILAQLSGATKIQVEPAQPDFCTIFWKLNQLDFKLATARDSFMGST